MRRFVPLLAVLALAATACRKPRDTGGAPRARGPSADASSPGILATDSAAHLGAEFTQAFYDWYAEHHEHLEDAVRQRPEVFAPDLLRALRADLAASRLHPDEVVGLDWDPFTGSQDPCLPMEVDVVTRRGDTLFVAMRGTCRDQPPRSYPDAIPELLQAGSGWVFVDIRHGGDGGTLRQDLAQLAASRDRAGHER